ncbi:RES family NAD+ phosphorylase [Cognatishimia activa]|uniref:RES family NAD+ phosphorylase n=1 Tax=Cognatishimia activa TaxID=1715691 RepID=A0A975EME2_9RHOB|nr:RES family NAD+ phosphorylase [Cognatishimia activa]QTN34832.1 RES family NAD+ phosphorylase [Cognatishimia activa]
MTISFSEHEEVILRKVCSNCTSEEYLAELIREEGEVEACYYCEDESNCVTVDELANKIEAAFNDHFSLTSTEPNAFQSMMLKDKESDYDWYREGQETVWAIADAARVSEDIARDVQSVLEYRHEDWDSALAGIECEFSSDAHYEEIMPENLQWHSQWDEFERLIKTEARFFSRTAASYLADLFDEIDQMRTHDGRSLIASAGPDTEITSLFRGRVFQSEEPLLEAMRRPDLGLAAPPATAAASGRMNARGISVFYGATTPEIALAEVRPPVGSRAAIARFDMIRPLRLLDLSALAEIQESGSIFDQSYAYRLGRMMFLRTLSSKMARPVMPDDQELEYLPTQAIADYLSTESKVPLDGILFPSVQVGGEGVNAVLFHKASRCEKLDLPEGTSIRANLYSMYEGGPEADYFVSEEVPPEEEMNDEGSSKRRSMRPPVDWRDNFDADPRIDALKVDTDSVRVHEINAVQIETFSHGVRRTRYEKRVPPF